MWRLAVLKMIDKKAASLSKLCIVLPVNHTMDQEVSRSMNGWMNGWMDELMNELMDGWITCLIHFNNISHPISSLSSYLIYHLILSHRSSHPTTTGSRDLQA